MRVACLLCLLMGAVPVQTMALTKEYKVKAAYLLNILLYVEWPEADQSDPLHICVDDQPDFVSFLSAVLESKPDNFASRPVVIAGVNARSAVKKCHMYYQFTALAAAPAAACNCMVIGDNRSYRRIDSTLNFYMAKGRVRFEVNSRKLDELGLKMSSKLLRLADVVDDW